MTEEEKEILVQEMRNEFQIPPYYSDEQLAILAKEGETVVGGLNPGQNISQDLTYRMLIKNYMYYAYYHRVSEFMDNYGKLILTWQMETEVETDGDA